MANAWAKGIWVSWNLAQFWNTLRRMTGELQVSGGQRGALLSAEESWAGGGQSASGTSSARPTHDLPWWGAISPVKSYLAVFHPAETGRLTPDRPGDSRADR